MVDTWLDYSYAFPPVPLITKCLAKIKYLDITVIMITTNWTSATWWIQLQELAIHHVLLGKMEDVCRPRESSKLPRIGSL